MRTSMLSAVLVMGCDPDSVPKSFGEALPDFSLEDVNTTSATHGQSVSPADYAGMASAWYFGHAN